MKISKTLGFFILLLSYRSSAQNNFYQDIFHDIAASFGDSKPVPQLEIIHRDKRCKIPAQYLPNRGVIQIEQCLLDLTKEFGKDSTTALAIIMGHELAHYYKQHEWCSEFAYSVKGTDLGNKIINISKDQRKINESQADDSGLFAIMMAGYKPFDIFPKIIDKIYNFYKLPEQLEGYPTKEERKRIAQEAEKKASKLYPVFLAGNFLFYVADYQKSAECYEYILKHFPSREVFNNLGVSKLLYVLSLKDKSDFPFILPIEIDPKTRLVKPVLRNAFDFDEDLVNEALEEAKKYFNEAIRKDKKYSEAYINFAICLLLQGNNEGALGKLNELAIIKKIQPTNALLVKAIAYFLDQQQNKALAILNLVEEKNQYLQYNTQLIKKGYSFFESKLDLMEWQENMLPTIHSSIPNLSITQKNNLPALQNWVELENGQKIGFRWIYNDLELEIISKNESWMLVVKESLNDVNLTNGFMFKKQDILEYISPQKLNIYNFYKKK
jgi:tetratricopeptide (TPR) repeat protein